jgi:hypothetical protein
MFANSRLVALLPALALLLLAAGCRIDEHKNGDGKNEDVKIATPFGGMSVKTNQAVVEGSVGLAVYPGATPEKKKKDSDDNAADVNLSFGSFHLGVKALSYTTPDSPDKVLAFYRKDMARFGTVILCHQGHAAGTPDHTQDGLTCDKEDHGAKFKSHGTLNGTNFNLDDDHAQDELKAGSRLHQHIVSIEPQGSGTKFGLVALDLPGHLGDDDKD